MNCNVGRRPAGLQGAYRSRYLRTTEADPTAWVVPDLINHDSATGAIDLGWGGLLGYSGGGTAAFVGRDRELSRLRSEVGGDTRLLLVMGDAGVGKTRLVTEAIRRAAAAGVVSVWGGCLPMRETMQAATVAERTGFFAPRHAAH